MSYLVGIDIGTSGLKTIIMNELGVIMALEKKDYLFDIPHPGWAEQDPDVWWEAAALTIRKALASSGIDAAEIKGIGLSGQMHGLVPIDKDMRAVRNAILHCDVRSEKQCSDLKAIFPDNGVEELTFNPIFPGMLFVSLLWMRDNEPDAFGKVKHVLSPKDYIRLRLTGETGAERTDASATSAYDMKAQKWSRQIISKNNIDENLFPSPISFPYETAGRISEPAAAATGLKTGTPVVYGGADQAMHSIGNGVYKPGTLMATIGTAGQVLTITDVPVCNPDYNTHTFCHVMPDTWYGLGAILNAGFALNWFRRNFCGELSYSEMSELAGEVPPGSEGLVFFPALMGERTPYLDPAARGMFFGITHKHTRAHFIRAIMEGVAFEMKSAMDIVDNLYCTEGPVIAAGGAASSPVWLQIQSDVFVRPLYTAKSAEQACTGAAIMAGIGAGIYKDIAEGCNAAVQKSSVHADPIKNNTEIYDDIYRSVFLKLYHQNNMLFRRYI